MSEQKPTRQDLPSHSLGPQGRRLGCEEWERLIPDVLDGALPAADFAAFEQHRQDCAACAQMLEEARQGVAWLGYLESDPPVPADLPAKILARTMGSAVSGPAAIVPATPAGIGMVSASPFPVWYRAALPAARRMIEPRLWMTAAMAFFSVALTLNLIGVRLSEIRLAVLRPSVVLTNLSRQYYSTKEEGVKYYDNLRFVYEMEAQVRELRRSQGSTPSALPEDTPRPESPISRNGGFGRKAPNPDTRTQPERSLA